MVDGNYMNSCEVETVTDRSQIRRRFYIITYTIFLLALYFVYFALNRNGCN